MNGRHAAGAFAITCLLLVIGFAIGRSSSEVERSLDCRIKVLDEKIACNKKRQQDMARWSEFLERLMPPERK